MSKKIVLLLAAALGLAACSHEQVGTADSAKDSTGIKFRIAMNRPATKSEIYFNSAANTLDGHVSHALAIRTVASFVNTAGETLNADYFVTSSDEPTMGDLLLDNDSFWYITPPGTTSGSDDVDASAIPFPFDANARMNTLFLAAPNGGEYFAIGTPDSTNPLRYWGDTQDGDYQSAQSHGWNDLPLATWYPVFSDDTDFTKKVDFINVDTYVNQMDLMYAACNNLKAGDSETITFDHAQAVLIFNLNISNKSVVASNPLFQSYAKAALLFVDPEANLSSDPSKQLKDVLTKTGFTEADLAAEISTWTDVKNFLTLKTVGTFTIDNSRNTLETSWDFSNWDATDPSKDLSSYVSVIKNGIQSNHFQYVAPNMDDNGSGSGPTDVANSNHPNASIVNNTTGHQSTFYKLNLQEKLCNVVTDQASDDPDYVGDPTSFVQVGEMLIPEQATVNPWLLFTPDGDHYYLKEVNLPRGTWQRGHAYIYNISFPFNGSASFTVNVSTYDKAAFTL